MAKWTNSIILGAVLGMGLGEATFAASFQGLGYLPGGERSSSAGAVSADGAAVVGWSGYEAFRWTATEGMQGLGDLPGGDFQSRAPAVSADGTVVVGWGLSDSGIEAFRWTAAEGMKGLGHLSGEGTRSLAAVVSADGAVVAGQTQATDSYASEVFRWTAAEGMKGLGVLAGGQYSEARALSADGSVVVGQSQSATGTQAFRWTAAEGVRALGYLPGGNWSIAHGVSGDGSVVVGQSQSAAGDQAFRWTSVEGMVALGSRPGISWSTALAVSADGEIVVGSMDTGTFDNPEGRRAFIWDRSRNMRDLQEEVLAGDSGLELAGWTLEEASGISADGLTIVGNGENPAGLPEAWIIRLDPADHQADQILPLAFALEENYPNPFNPGTNIRFSLPKAAVVRLAVYNLEGQQVATLIEGKRYEAGSYAVTFERAGLASGIYLCRLKAGDFQQVRKMTLLK